MKSHKLIDHRVSVAGGHVDLDDETAVAEAVEKLPEENRAAFLQAAKAKPVANVRMRILTEPHVLAAGEPDPETGLPLEEASVGLETGVIFQWETVEQEWAQRGTDPRRELAAMVPYLQAMLGLQLMASAVNSLEKHFSDEQKSEMKVFLESANRMVAGQAILYQPIFEMVMNWYSDRSGAAAEAEALLQGAN